MKRILDILKNDFKNFITYRIIYMVLIISAAFALAMGFFAEINPLLYIFISVFIFPVIIFSITLFIEREDNSTLPKSFCQASLIELIIGKILSAFLLMLIPYFLYLIVMLFVLNLSFSFLLYTLVYFLSAIVHIVVGFSITVMVKNYIRLSIYYVIYILVFSFIPFLYIMNVIPNSLTYLFVFSPAYLYGVVFDNVFFGYLYSDVLFIVIAGVLPIVIADLLVYFVLRPYFKGFLNSKCEVRND